MRRDRSDGRAVRRCAGLIAALGVVLTAGPPVRLSAQGDPLNSGALFLIFPVGAQAVGRGQAAVAGAGRGEAAFWNPAGLATLETSEFALHSATLAAGPAHALTAYFPSRSIGVVGIAVYLVDYGNLESTDSSGNPIARISPRNLEFLASYATELAGTFALGISYKLVEFRVDCSGDCRGFTSGQGVTHGLDVGGQLAMGSKRALRLGLAVRNVGFKLQVNNRDQADALPARLLLGALYHLQLPAPAAGRGEGEGEGEGEEAGGRSFDLTLAADVDSPWGNYAASEMRVGLDVGYERLLRVRGGYAFLRDGLGGPSVGIGLTSGAIGIDLARTFLTGSELVTENPTFVSFRLVF